MTTQAKLTQDINLHALALRNSMVLKINQSTRGHLNGTENSHDFQDPIVEARRQETVVFFRSAWR